MTVRDAERQARQQMGARVNVTHTSEWVITQWGLTDSCYKQERVIGQATQWAEALEQATTNWRKPWT